MSGKVTIGAGGLGGVSESPPPERPGAIDLVKVAALVKAEELKALGAQLIKAGLAFIKAGDEATAKAEASQPAAKPHRRRHGRGRGGRGGGKKARKADAAELNPAPVADDVAEAVILAHSASSTAQGTIGANNDEKGVVDNSGKPAQRRRRHRGGRRQRRRQADAGAGGDEQTASSLSQASPIVHPESGATSPPMEISLSEEVIAALATSMSQVAIARPLLKSQEDWLIEFTDSG
ncbi:hypothetical protein N7451_002943 [Penicillium sp. IBT 35674x]|nr:hypothetical protein N7451_002943 [Penicillium sp. IBT 35674x]